jgi:hypothetical protein
MNTTAESPPATMKKVPANSAAQACHGPLPGCAPFPSSGFP